MTLLRAVTTNLDGTGIRIGQVEGGSPNWEVSPGGTGVSSNKFNWLASGFNTNVFPNSLGLESAHADLVGSLFYGLPGGAVTNAAHADNFEASYFSQLTLPLLKPITDSVVNLSFTITGISTTTQQGYDSTYDGYAAQLNTIFIGAAGDGGRVAAPATCYNGIGVGAYGGSSSTGPTADNGRAKPDITAPGSATSFSAPLVSACAAILLEAGLRGDGGSDTNSASDLRTIKALLINGAVKPPGWANPSPSPLDPLYGAGVVNVFNSYSQLVGGKHGFIASNTVTLGEAHPAAGAAGNVASLNGWDFNTVSSSSTNDSINHYFFNLGTDGENTTFTGTATLVWNRQFRQTNINNLDLFLCQADSGNIVAASISAVDNVEHIFITTLNPGRYDLQVLKHGGPMVSATENYAVAFEFFVMPISLVKSGMNAALMWPIYPAGFRLESNAGVNFALSWLPANLTPALSNNQNVVILNPSNGSQFFRLIRP